MAASSAAAAAATLSIAGCPGSSLGFSTAGSTPPSAAAAERRSGVDEARACLSPATTPTPTAASTPDAGPIGAEDAAAAAAAAEAAESAPEEVSKGLDGPGPRLLFVLLPVKRPG